MKELTQVLQDATRAIGAGYFRLSIDGGDPIYRERVYCYELYHQMRCRWPSECPFYLNGEIDKAAHPILMTLGADHTKPDFLVHRPGHAGLKPLQLTRAADCLVLKFRGAWNGIENRGSD